MAGSTQGMGRILPSSLFPCPLACRVVRVQHKLPTYYVREPPVKLPLSHPSRAPPPPFQNKTKQRKKTKKNRYKLLLLLAVATPVHLDKNKTKLKCHHGQNVSDQQHANRTFLTSMGYIVTGEDHRQEKASLGQQTTNHHLLRRHRHNPPPL